MATLLDALVDLDNLARLSARALGERSRLGAELLAGMATVRRTIAPLALHQQAERYDPKADLKRVFAAAEDAGLSWPDLVEALNTYREQAVRRG